MEEISSVWVLIPAYKPEEGMVELTRALVARGFSPNRIILVDDGGGRDYAPLFARAAALGAVVLNHEVNRGKGAALKTGIGYILQHGAAPVVTCDADGQHTPEDIERVARASLKAPEALVLGVRDKKQMPPKSRMGNSMTCFFLGATTGLWIRDTQTGLRGLPAGALERFSRTQGDRYEYETAVLIEARHARIAPVQVVINTLYFDRNAGSHFRPLKDGMLIYRLIFGQVGRYIGSSALASLIDLGLFALLCYVLPDQFERLHLSGTPLSQVLSFLLPETIGVPALAARVVSSLVNYFVNKDVVFKRRAGRRSIFYYYLLAAGVLLLDIQLIRLMTMVGLPTIVAKILADGIMFVVSYNVQRRFVFRDRSKQV